MIVAAQINMHQKGPIKHGQEHIKPIRIDAAAAPAVESRLFDAHTHTHPKCLATMHKIYGDSVRCVCVQEQRQKDRNVH